MQRRHLDARGASCFDPLVRGDGFGAHRRSIDVTAAQTDTLSPVLAAKVAAAARGLNVRAAEL